MSEQIALDAIYMVSFIAAFPLMVALLVGAINLLVAFETDRLWRKIEEANAAEHGKAGENSSQAVQNNAAHEANTKPVRD